MREGRRPGRRPTREVDSPGRISEALREKERKGGRALLLLVEAAAAAAEEEEVEAEKEKEDIGGVVRMVGRGVEMEEEVIEEEEEEEERKKEEGKTKDGGCEESGVLQALFLVQSLLAETDEELDEGEEAMVQGEGIEMVGCVLTSLNKGR